VRYIFYDEEGNVTVSLNRAHRFDNSNLMAGASYIVSPGSESLPALNLSAVLYRELDNPFQDDGEPLDIDLVAGISKR
jgi:hypothetical protein